MYTWQSWLNKLKDMMVIYICLCWQTLFSFFSILFIFINTEMIQAVKNVATKEKELTVEERNLLSVAYKNVIGARRASWRIISSLEQKEELKGLEGKLELIRSYRQLVENELKDICNDILNVLDKYLINSATTGESKVFYYKMCVVFLYQINFKALSIFFFSLEIGKEIIIAILQNLPLVIVAKMLQKTVWLHTKLQLR